MFQMDWGNLTSDVHKSHKSQKRINVKENIDTVPSNVQSRVKKLYCMCLRTMKL